MNFAFAAPYNGYGADPADIFNVFFNFLFGDFGQIHDIPVARYDDIEHRNGIHIQLLHDRGFRPVGQIVFNEFHFIAYFLRGYIAVFIHHKLDADQGRPFHTLGLDFVNPFHLVDGFFNNLGNGSFNFFRAGARQCGLHQHIRHIHIREHSYPHGGVRHQPHHHNRHTHHNRSDRPADKHRGKTAVFHLLPFQFTGLKYIVIVFFHTYFFILT